MSKLYPTHCYLWLPLGLPWRPAPAEAGRCCEKMAMALEHDCEQHETPWDCPDTVLIYHEPFDEFGIPVRDGGASVLLIEHCPWCGVRLPPSQRDRWFDELDALGIDEQQIADIPARFLSAEWRTRPA